MNNEIFDRETKLDLLVNVIPLFIMAFFIVGFVVFAPFGIDPLASAIQFGLIAIPFVLLSVLTYFAAVAVAGSENSGPVYLPGQAGVTGAEPLEVPDEKDDEPVPDDAAAAALDDESESEASDPDAEDDDVGTAEDEGDGADADDAEDTTDAEDDATGDDTEQNS